MSIVLCIERDSYISTIVALQMVIQMTPNEETKAQMRAAFADFQRAHAMHLALDARRAQALLRRA